MNVKECNLREFINIQMQSVIENSVEVESNMLRVRVSESVSSTISQIEYLVGSKITMIYDRKEIEPGYKWAEL
jgi:hypothetical protein